MMYVVIKVNSNNFAILNTETLGIQSHWASEYEATKLVKQLNRCMLAASQRAAEHKKDNKNVSKRNK